MSGQRNVAQAILEQLGAWGVSKIYGLAGDAGDLDKALREALNSGRPALVEVITADLPVPGTVMPK